MTVPLIMTMDTALRDVGATTSEIPVPPRQDAAASGLRRMATPYVDSLGRDLDGTGIAVILVDHCGSIIARHVGDELMRRRLDGVGLAPGYPWSIEATSASAIGAAVRDESAAPVSFATASAPINDIRTATPVGVLTLMRGADASNDLLLPVARQSAHALEQQLAAASLRVGARPRSASAQRRSRVSFGWASLTASESTLAALVAEGCTNREAARRLFVSRHTVDAHLRHIFRKLGINSRVELARIATANAIAGADATRAQPVAS